MKKYTKPLSSATYFLSFKAIYSLIGINRMVKIDGKISYSFGCSIFFLATKYCRYFLVLLAAPSLLLFGISWTFAYSYCLLLLMLRIFLTISINLVNTFRLRKKKNAYFAKRTHNHKNTANIFAT